MKSSAENPSEVTVPASTVAETMSPRYIKLENKEGEVEQELDQPAKTTEATGTTYVSNLSLRRQAKLQALIGKKIIVDC